MKTFVCMTSTTDEIEVSANDEEDAAMLYAAAVLSDFPGAFAAVWVGKKEELGARVCCTIIVPGKGPLETEQFNRFVEWYMMVKGISRELAWNKAIFIITRADMGFELTPGIVPISLSDRETVTGKIEIFEWILAGGSH